MTIGIYGTGRFGAFWASTLAKDHGVVCYNRSERPVPAGTELVELDDLCHCDAIFLCVAISAVKPVLRQLAPHLGPQTMILDTCSVKVYPVSLMASILPSTSPIIGTHPMFGPDSAGNGVVGLPLVYCPVRCSESQEQLWKETFTEMGLRVVPMTPEQHDREAAFTQGITHFIGRVLADLRLTPSEIATVGYIQLLSVIEQTCNDPFQLFVDLQRYNPFTNDMRRQLQSSLHRLLESVETHLDSE